MEMCAWNSFSNFINGTCKTLGCHLGPLEELFPYKSMAVLGSQNGTIKKTPNPPLLWKKKKRPLLCVTGGGGGEWGLFTLVTFYCNCRWHPVRYFLLLYAVAGLCSELYFTGKNKSYLFTQSHASLEHTMREGNIV